MCRGMQAENHVAEHEDQQQGLHTLAAGEKHRGAVLTKVPVLTTVDAFGCVGLINMNYIKIIIYLIV